MASEIQINKFKNQQLGEQDDKEKQNDDLLNILAAENNLDSLREMQ